MRLAPVPLFFARRPEVAIRRAAESSRTTHGAPEAVDACRYLAGLIVGAVQGRSKKELLAPLFTPVAALWNREPLAPRIHEIAAGSFLRREPPDIRGTGYVVQSLEAALWAFAKSTSFEHGAFLAVNLGDDADTTGAVYGQLAGAYYGADAIPPGWRSKLAHLDTLENFAARLLVAASRSAGPFPFQNNESQHVVQLPVHGFERPIRVPFELAQIHRALILGSSQLRPPVHVAGQFGGAGAFRKSGPRDSVVAETAAVRIGTRGSLVTDARPVVSRSSRSPRAFRRSPF
jgi:hypothetical protein